MKRLFKVIGLLLLLIVGAMIILPIVFKDEIVVKVNNLISENLEAEVEIGDFNLSLFRSFPNFNFQIENVTVDGKNNFKGIRLLDVGEFELELDVWSVISGENYNIKGINLKNTSVHVLIDESGNANYDISKESESSTEVENTGADAESSDFQLSLNSYSIENFNLLYTDKQAKVSAEIIELNHSGSGNFSEDIVGVKTNTEIKSLSALMDGIAYLNKVETKADFDLEIDNNKGLFTFGENLVKMNDLQLNFTGSVSMPEGENMAMDLQFSSPQSSFKSVLSLIPSIYFEGFEDLKTEGNFSLKGELKGEYDEVYEKYPGFDFDFNVEDASIQYPDLPAAVKGINISTHIYNKSSDLDNMVIDVKKAKALVAGSPIDATMNLKTPISDPNIKAYLKTDFNLSNIAKAIPMEGFDYSGNIKADLNFGAKMSDIDNEDYEKVKAEGAMEMKDVVFGGSEMPLPITIKEAKLLFSPQYADLQSFTMLFAKSDLSASGRIDNLLPYALRDDSLHGVFNVSSNMLNLTELSKIAPEEEGQSVDSSQTATSEGLPRIPQNLDFELNTDVKEVLMDSLQIQNIKGKMALKKGKAEMENLQMDLIGGSVKLSGYYDSKPAQPKIDMNLAIKDFGFKESFESLEIVQKMVPIMQNTEGKFSSSFAIQSLMNEDYSLDLNSVLAEGNLFTNGLKTSPKSMQKLSEILKNPSLSSLDIGKIDLKFKIENGRVEVEPFDIKAGNINASVSGSNGLDQSLDYKMDMKIPVSGIKASNLLANIGASSGSKVDLAVNIGGTFTDPKISTSFGDLVNNVLDNIKNQVNDKVEEVKQDAIDKVNEESQKLIDQAAAKGDELIAEAEKAAQKLNDVAAENAQKIRDEAEKQASKLEEEAKGNFLKEKAAEKAAKALRDKADKESKKIEDEAAEQGKKLIDEAKAKKLQLVKEAEEKAKI
tara:strand:- start:320837 stop:323659 length:2823 start_codon:yes stop_codon:yes gene_type:complete